MEAGLVIKYVLPQIMNGLSVHLRLLYMQEIGLKEKYGYGTKLTLE